MELTLSNLKRDYKQIKKVNFELAQKLLALVEFLKIESYYKRQTHLHSKKIKLYALCEGLGISLRTLYRWRAAYIKNGIFGLNTKRGRGKPATPIPEDTQLLITEMRKQFRWGPEVIQAHLRFDHHIYVSRYKIDRFLNRSGLRDKYPCTTKKARRKKIKPHTKKVVIDHPGEHTQMDTKHLPKHLKDDKKCYVYNFVDHASNWSFKYAYSKLNTKTTEDFLERLHKACPFIINSIQTDHGKEFTYKMYWKERNTDKEHPLDIFCSVNNIRHRLIIPGEKELQGLVERSHRQDDQEFYISLEPMELKEFNRHLKEFCSFRNDCRRFKKLDWKTPNEWLANYSLSHDNHKLDSLDSDQNGDVLPLIPVSKKENNIKEIEVKDDRLNTKKAA